MSGVSVLVSGCAGAFHGRAATPGTPYRGAGTTRLRIAVFEIEPLELPFHTGLIIHAPDGHVLYDPAGFWHDPRAPRIDDVSHGLTPELEQDYLSRASSGLSADQWRVHLFETEVPAEVARQAVELAQERAPAVFGACAWNVSAVLQDLPGYEDILPSLLPEDLLRQLQARNDLRYLQPEFG
ncbi:MAG: hypothetical protein ACK4LQ_04310 [Pararhodobacter sp.]